MRAYVIAILGVAVVLLSGGVGYFIAGSNAAESVASARSDATSCTDAAATQEAALKDMTARFDALRDNHETLRKAAERALDQRDDALAQLNDEALARANRIHQAGQHDASTVPLARMPLPAAVARELFPRARAPGRAPGRND